MMNVFRRSRTLLLGLILLSPGLSRVPKELLHSCPMAAAHAAGPMAMAHGASAPQDAPDHGEDCRCVARCWTAAVAMVAPTTPTMAWHPSPDGPASIRGSDTPAIVARPAYFLPPSTAPPAA